MLSKHRRHSFPQIEMTDSLHYEAVKLLARSRVYYSGSRAEEAVELLHEVLAMGERDEKLKRLYPYRAAHANLYKIYRAQGNVPKAWEHLTRALELGSTEAELGTDDALL
jgi:tetratricopeptide (TPR) repeat protein